MGRTSSRTAPEDLVWSLVVDGPLPGAVNMARDHALAGGLQEGTAVLRLYGWLRPTLSFGRNEPASEMYDRRAVDRSGVDVVRRPTGGRAVLHHREVTYAVATPLRAFGGVRSAYLRVNTALVGGLAVLGVSADIAERTSGERAAPPGAGPCFRTPAEGEVTVAGRKLVGSAQARVGRALLQHGSILLADDQGWVDELSGSPAGEAPATLAGVLGVAPGVDEVVEAVVAGFRSELGGRWDGPRPEVAETEERLVDERYGTENWTWRR